jgi:hypothetical protein
MATKPLVSASQMKMLAKFANMGNKRPFTVMRVTRVENEYGFADEWTEVGSGVGWLKQMNNPRTQEQVGHIARATNIYRLHCEIPTTWMIKEGDRVHMEGLTYEVNNSNEDETWIFWMTILMRLLQ